MIHLYLKAIHIFGFVTWFAGLFYLARLFVYHIEAIEENKSDELKSTFAVMEKRLFSIITTPGMLITLICGIGMLINHPDYLQQSWLHIKLLLIVLLVAYHGYCYRLMKALAADKLSHNSWQMRLINELPTILLAAIVFLAVLKSNLNALYATLGFILFTVALFVFAKMYKRRRESNKR